MNASKKIPDTRGRMILSNFLLMRFSTALLASLSSNGMPSFWSTSFVLSNSLGVELVFSLNSATSFSDMLAM
jgi:hypothetical protein